MVENEPSRSFGGECLFSLEQAETKHNQAPKRNKNLPFPPFLCSTFFQPSRHGPTCGSHPTPPRGQQMKRLQDRRQQW
ncbi:hypothetical protein CPC08DRAFT_308112 [Agrocybe pediades]|nr:hypothetical protein CPC08DRAFT_308112 [Agrocybe pediades]